MIVKPITATAVASLKRAAKTATKTEAYSLTYMQALESQARLAGYASWHAVVELLRRAIERTAGPPMDLPMDPELPPDFYNTPNEDRPESEIADWWERPYACSREDGSFEVCCLDGGAWDRPTFYGIAPDIPAACELARSKLERWRRMAATPVLMIGQSTYSMVLMSQKPGTEPLVLAELPTAEEAGKWSKRWRENHPDGGEIAELR